MAEAEFPRLLLDDPVPKLSLFHIPQHDRDGEMLQVKVEPSRRLTGNPCCLLRVEAAEHQGVYLKPEELWLVFLVKESGNSLGGEISVFYLHPNCIRIPGKVTGGRK